MTGIDQDPGGAEPAPRVPPPVFWLGAAGALPFMAGALLAILGAPDLSGPALLSLRAYGAAILAFMGGIHWGLAIAEPLASRSWRRLSWSVVPALAAWAALLVESRHGLIFLSLAFAALLAGDLIASRRGAAPAWYPRLRWPLTGVVVSALVLAATA